MITSTDTRGTQRAHRLFGEESTLMISRPKKGCMSCTQCWFSVPEGFFALVTRHGVREDYVNIDGNSSCVWPPGVHIGPPWLKVSHLITKQSLVFNDSIHGCNTKDNVRVNIEVSTTIRVMGDQSRGEDPENVYNFVHLVTARGLQSQLKEAQSEAFHSLIGKMNHNEVYGLMQHKESVSTLTAPPLEDIKDGTEDETLISSGFRLFGTEQLSNEMSSKASVVHEQLAHEFSTQGIEVLEVIVRNVSLPTGIVEQMSKKTFSIAQNAERRMQQKYDMLLHLHSEQLATLQQSIEEEKMELMKSGELDVLKESFELESEKAMLNDALEKIRAQMNIDVELIVVENEATVQRIGDETKLDVEKIEWDAKVEEMKAKVDAQCEIQYIEAEADLKCSLNEKEGGKKIIRAEEISIPLNRQLNDYTTNIRKIQVQDALAKNNNLILTGTNGGKLANKMLLAEAALKDVTNVNRKLLMDNERASLLTEFAKLMK